MITDIIKSTLLELGCDEQDSRVYQSLLDGIVSVTQLSIKLSLHREKIYTSLNNLNKIGLVNKKRDYSRSIEVTSPMHILSLLKIKAARTNKSAQDFGEILPDILLNFGDSIQDKKIEHFVGENDFIKAFDEQIDTAKSEILCFISPIFLYEAIDISFLKYWVKKRIRNNIKIKLLAPIEHRYIYENDDELLPNEEKLREIKYFESQLKFQGTYCICDSKVYFFNPILMEVFIITDKITTQTLRTSFELLWNSSPT